MFWTPVHLLSMRGRIHRQLLQAKRFWVVVQCAAWSRMILK